MGKVIALLFFLCSVGVANAQVTYTATVGNYTSLGDYTSCTGVVPCANYTTAMKQTGSFTVAAALAPNLASADVTGSVTSYSFSDGINTYSNTNPDDRILAFVVATDASGNITGSTIYFEKWLSGTNGSHAPLDKVAGMQLGVTSFHNAPCYTLGVSPFSGVQEVCINFDPNDPAASFAVSPAVSWASSAATAPTPVPTLSEWAMVIMGSLMALIAVRKMRHS